MATLQQVNGDCRFDSKRILQPRLSTSDTLVSKVHTIRQDLLDLDRRLRSQNILQQEAVRDTLNKAIDLPLTKKSHT